MRRMIDGKRGEFLLAGGAVFTAIGLSYVAVRTPSRAAGFAWLPEMFEPHYLGWIWVLCGVFCVVSALLSKKCQRLMSLAYAALMLPPTAWSAIFLGAWIAGTHPLGWVSTLSYGLMAIWIRIVSGWPNPLPRSLLKQVTGPIPTVSTKEDSSG